MGEKYKIIYADPPWVYKNYAYAKTKNGDRAKRGIAKEYGTMSLPEIKAIPVSPVSGDDSLLFLWATCPLLDQAISVVSAWGFTFYSVAFLWVKAYAKSGKDFWGMGNWTRSNAELVLLGIRGKPVRMSASVHQIVKYPVSKHSQKPSEVRDRIVQLCGDVPRLELFAREQAPGWDAMGYDIDGKDIRIALAEKIVEQEG